MTGRIALTVLAREGPQARAYLVRMARAGIRPARILLMVRGHRKDQGGPLSALTAGLRLRFAERLQDARENHHPRAIRKAHPRLVHAIADGLTPIAADSMACIDEMYTRFSYERYADDVVRVPATDYRDPQLVETLALEAPGTVLFTGGGIVPARVLSIPGLRMIHVHTGVVPKVRGADVLLWSILLRGRPGVSAFFLAPRLDRGDVIAATDLPPIRVRLPGNDVIDADTQYRAVFSFIDPLIRAEFLVSSVLAPAADISTLSGAPQPAEGLTFHFMHPLLRRRALGALFFFGQAITGGPSLRPGV